MESDPHSEDGAWHMMSEDGAWHVMKPSAVTLNSPCDCDTVVRESREQWYGKIR